MLPFNTIPQYRGSNIANSVDERSLLPFLVGAAFAFPIGYIASNTKNNQQQYQMPYPMPYPQYQVPYPVPYQPYPVYPY